MQHLTSSCNSVMQLQHVTDVYACPDTCTPAAFSNVVADIDLLAPTAEDYEHWISGLGALLTLVAAHGKAPDAVLLDPEQDR